MIKAASLGGVSLIRCYHFCACKQKHLYRWWNYNKDNSLRQFLHYHDHDISDETTIFEESSIMNFSRPPCLITRSGDISGVLEDALLKGLSQERRFRLTEFLRVLSPLRI